MPAEAPNTGSGQQRPLKVLSLHWGFSVGGGAKYAAEIEGVGDYAFIELHTLAVLGRRWGTDRQLLSRLDNVTEIPLASRSDPSWMRRVAREVHRARPDLLMTHGFNGHFVALVACGLSGTRPGLICSYHGEYYAPTPGRRIFAGAFNRFTRHYLRHWALSTACVSEYSRSQLIAAGIPADKVVAIHNGIDAGVEAARGSRERLRNAWGAVEDDLLLGVVCRLDPIKGLSHLLDAVARLVSAGRRLRLVLVGGGPLEEDLRTRARSLRLEARIVFTGFRTDVVDCLAAFDIFALPSLAENHSVALLEAMRAGRAIVATDVGGNGESVTHEREALIVPAANPAALEGAIDRLCSDPDLRARLASAARDRFLRSFTTEQMLRRTAEWMEGCGRRSCLGKVGCA